MLLSQHTLSVPQKHTSELLLCHAYRWRHVLCHINTIKQKLLWNNICSCTGGNKTLSSALRNLHKDMLQCGIWWRWDLTGFVLLCACIFWKVSWSFVSSLESHHFIFTRRKKGSQDVGRQGNDSGDRHACEDAAPSHVLCLRSPWPLWCPRLQEHGCLHQKGIYLFVQSTIIISASLLFLQHQLFWLFMW